jgi:hypothetical protein
VQVRQQVYKHFLVTTDKLAIASLEEVIKDLEKLSVGNEMMR